MKELRKKRELEDMLITHKPKEQDKDKTGREAKDKGKADVKDFRKLERMKRKLFSTTDPNEGEAILDTIQEVFGNEVAEDVIKGLRLLKGESGTSTSDSGTYSDKKTKD